jgi:hypothetical protein
MNDLSILVAGEVSIPDNTSPSPFRHIEDIVRSVDISIFNNASPYASNGAPNLYSAPPHSYSSLAVLAASGFQACTMANQNVLSWGADAMAECMQRLREGGIEVVGAGDNEMNATAPLFLERRGLRIAFLGYNCLGPNIYRAEAEKPGCAMVRIHTHYEPYEYVPGCPALVTTRAYQGELHALQANIRRAKSEADYLILYFCWGLHRTRAVVCDYQFEVAHACIDAGADAVLGSGAGLIKGIEVYKGKPVFYGLGTLVSSTSHDKGRPLASVHTMHQEIYGRLPDEEARLSMIAQLVVSSGGHLSASFRPLFLHEDGPEPLLSSDPRGIELLRYVRSITQEVGLDTNFDYVNEDICIRAGERGWSPRSSSLLTV